MGNASCKRTDLAVAVAPSIRRARHHHQQQQPQQQPAEQQPQVPFHRANDGGLRIAEVYRLDRELGRGGSGAITRLAVRRKTSAVGEPNKLACKTIWKSKTHLQTPEQELWLWLEPHIMASLPRHPSLARLREVYEDGDAVHLVMDLYDDGSLADKISTWEHRTEEEVAMEAVAVATAVRALHGAGVMHRDLKPDNMLYNQKDGQLKVIDFDLAVKFRPGNNVFTETVGTSPYIAPEVWEGNYGPEADVWSAGVIFYEMLCGYRPFRADDEEDLKNEILHGAVDLRGDPWPLISNSAKSLILQMLDRDINRRLTAQQVLGHPWLKDRAKRLALVAEP